MTLIEQMTPDISEVELIYKSKVKAKDRPRILSTKDAYKIVRGLWDDNKIELFEQFKVLYLNPAKYVLAAYNLSSGGTASTVADPKLLFTAALQLNACSILIAHNHPSGNLTPSRADILLTRKLQQAGEFLDIELMDHLIVSSEGYYSFADCNVF